MFHLSVQIGRRTYFEGNNKIGKNTIFEGSIGFGSYIGENCKISADIGRFCSISDHVRTISATHPAEKFVSTHPCFFSTKKQAGFTFVEKNKFSEYRKVNQYDISVGNDVWIGTDVLILGGVHVGDGSIIAAGAVVSSNIPEYAIYGGVPAKKIRDRFPEEKITYLKKMKWWDRPLDWIKRNAELFDDVDKLMVADYDK